MESSEKQLHTHSSEHVRYLAKRRFMINTVLLKILGHHPHRQLKLIPFMFGRIWLHRSVGSFDAESEQNAQPDAEKNICLLELSGR